jgi:hypothetical protein
MEDIPKATHDTTPTSTAPPPTRRGLLAGAGLILAAAAVTAATVAESPDAELLAECERFIQGEADYGRLCRAADFSSDETITPAKRAVIDAFNAHSEAHHARGYWLANCEPQTVAGIRAKARAALVYVGPNDPVHDMIGALERSVLVNLAGEGVTA